MPRTHRNLTWLSWGSRTFWQKKANTKVTRDWNQFRHTYSSTLVTQRQFELMRVQPMEWTLYVSASNRLSDKWLDYSWSVLEIFQLLQVLATQLMHPGNIVENGSRVFWKIHHTHKSTDNGSFAIQRVILDRGVYSNSKISWFAPDPLNQDSAFEQDLHYTKLLNTALVAEHLTTSVQ